jgi:hypothetical protein
MFDVPPFISWAAFAELTFVRSDAGIINDADISLVDNFYLPMAWDWLYSDNSGLNSACYNTSIDAFPDASSCNANGGEWTAVPATAYSGAPTAYCKSPNILCQDPANHDVCKQNLDKFQPLINQLDHIYGDLQAETLSNGAASFTWAQSDRSLFPGQVWTCSGFQNTGNFQMAEMCSAINRGLCDLSALGSLSASDFASWTQNTCGTQQCQQPESAWFVGSNVRNPYAYWLRRTLQGTTYSFSQDEGLHGGNSNCNNINPPTSRVPDSSRITLCPGNNVPTPSPSPSSGWVACSSTSTACCNPYSSPQQFCPGSAALACQQCGGGSACECPSGTIVGTWNNMDIIV